MARVLVDGDHETIDRIRAALRSAGLTGVEVEMAGRAPDVAAFPAGPGNWAALADVGAGASYADWRHELLTFLDWAGPAAPRWIRSPGEAAPLPTELRRTG